MPKKMAENSKAVAARERKAAAAEVKKAKEDEARRRKEDEEWSVGARSNDKERLEAEKRAAKLAAKKEREALEAKEAAELAAMKKAKPPPALRGEEKKAQAATKRIESSASAKEPTPEYEARSIDAALDLLTIATAPAGASTSSDKLDRHPERRMKAAYAAYEEKYLPILKAENPGLRLSQLKERLFKQWQKAPENPMNQGAGRYDLTAEEERELTAAQREARLESMRVDAERQQRRLSAGDDEAVSAKKAGKAKKASNGDASSSEGEE